MQLIQRFLRLFLGVAYFPHEVVIHEQVFVVDSRLTLVDEVELGFPHHFKLAFFDFAQTQLDLVDQVNQFALVTSQLTDSLAVRSLLEVVGSFARLGLLHSNFCIFYLVVQLLQASERRGQFCHLLVVFKVSDKWHLLLGVNEVGKTGCIW